MTNFMNLLISLLHGLCMLTEVCSLSIFIYLFIIIFYWTAFMFHLFIYQFINTSGFQLAQLVKFLMVK